MKGIHNFSEIGKLNKVLLHRIGHEVEGLVPDNFARLLFDDIPFLTVAQREHDAFAKVLMDNGVEVVYYVDELEKALANPQIKAEFLRRFMTSSHLDSPTVEEVLFEYLYNMPTREMIEKIIAGVKRNDVPEFESQHFADFISSGYPFYMDPLPNMYMTRDAGVCVGSGISIHHMSTLTRRRESLLLKYIYKYDRDFAEPENGIWYDYDDPISIEGGDVLVLNKKTVIVGLSERTTATAIEHFAKNLLKGSGFTKIYVMDIPKARASMQLDTVFSMIDYDKFLIHPEIVAPLRVFEMKLEKTGDVRFSTMTDSLESILKKVLKLPAVELIPCGGSDPMAAQREQWNDASNTLCIEPGKVVTYARNYITNDILDRKGLTVLAVPGSELSRGRGGTRSMTCPISREDL